VGEDSHAFQAFPALLVVGVEAQRARICAGTLLAAGDGVSAGLAGVGGGIDVILVGDTSLALFIGGARLAVAVEESAAAAEVVFQVEPVGLALCAVVDAGTFATPVVELVAGVAGVLCVQEGV
jgi:hypothetical protein